MGRFKNEVYGAAFPRDGEIPKTTQEKIEDALKIFSTLYPEEDTDKIRELMCLLYRRRLIDMR